MHSISTGLYSVFHQHIYKNPGRTYLHSKYGEISYIQAKHIIHSFAEKLNSKIQIQQNKTIAASYTNPDVLFFIIWACVEADISLVLLPPLKDASYVKEILNDTGAPYLVSDVEELNGISENIECPMK